MTRRRAFVRLEPTARFRKSYTKLDRRTQDECDAALHQLLVEPLAADLQLKPILPTTTYWEARVNRRDRLIILPDGTVAHIMDVVTHDEIRRWSRYIPQ